MLQMIEQENSPVQHPLLTKVNDILARMLKDLKEADLAYKRDHGAK